MKKIEVPSEETAKVSGSVEVATAKKFDERVKRMRVKPGKLLNAILKAALAEMDRVEALEAKRAAEADEGKEPETPPGEETTENRVLTLNRTGTET